ncbi:MAG: hypothetical protein AAGD00_11105 [Planctomycetota bacterium]
MSVPAIEQAEAPSEGEPAGPLPEEGVEEKVFEREPEPPTIEELDRAIRRADEGREPAVGDLVRVEYRDGTAVRGELAASDDVHIDITISGVTVRIRRGDLAQISRIPSAMERYQRLRGIIDPRDSERLFALAQWCQREGLLPEALSEVTRLLEVDDTNGDAIRLRTEVREQIELLQRASEREERRGRRAEDRDESSFRPRPKPDAFPLLGERAINLIKVYELDLENPPAMTVERETVQELLATHASHPLIPTSKEGRAAFFGKAPAEVLEIMFRVRARELYGRVRVQGQPANMELFRDRVHVTWLINNCATTRCHGGPAGGSFQLTNRHPRSDASVYTNFLIMDRYELADGTPLIDYASPMESPLLQLGLPAYDSSTPHPRVEGWRPAFRTRGDRRFEDAVRWIESMYRPRPEYPIQYPPRRVGEAVPTPTEDPLER